MQCLPCLCDFIPEAGLSHLLSANPEILPRRANMVGFFYQMQSGSLSAFSGGGRHTVCVDAGEYGTELCLNAWEPLTKDITQPPIS